MEEDIKILEDMKTWDCILPNKRQTKAIENLINKYKEQEKVIELMAKAFKQDDIRNEDEIIEYFRKEAKKMRDPKRIDEFCDKLKEYWHKVPDWRFGQLMVNFLGSIERDPFFPEEDEMLVLMEKYFKNK